MTAGTVEEQVYRDNLELNRLEYQAGRVFLWSRPRFLGLVIGNACNLQCRHCYQAKNGDRLLHPAGMGRELRGEIAGLYPYVSTLRVLGGEVLALEGFADLLEDVRSTVTRPLLSISTNGTLVDDSWAERMVRMPFASVTFSIDGATAETMARLRGGASLDAVVGGVRRVLEWKRRLGSELPRVDVFFVLMRSNFREIPAFLRLMCETGVRDVAFQTMEVNAENSQRAPELEREESIADRDEVVELHALVRNTLARERPHFRMILLSGLESLFAAHGLDSGFLSEREQGLYPESDGLDGGEGFRCCPNPWTTLFVSENGGAHLCFLAEPLASVYEMPLAAIWNSPAAVTKRSEILAGRYLRSGCSERWCSCREGTAGAVFGNAHAEFKELARQAMNAAPLPEGDGGLASVRRAARARTERIAELEGRFRELCAANGAIHEFGQRYIDELEARLDQPLVRAAERIARFWKRWLRPQARLTHPRVGG